MVRTIVSLFFELCAGAIFAASFFVLYWLALEIGQVEPYVAVIIGVAGAGLATWGVVYFAKRGSGVLGVVSDPIFGEVRCHKDTWEAAVHFECVSREIEVSGLTQRPTAEQRETWLCLCERWKDFQEASLRAAVDVLAFLGDKAPKLSSEDLVVEDFILDDGPAGCFSITVEAPAHQDVLKWGLRVDFVDYRVEYAEALH